MAALKLRSRLELVVDGCRSAVISAPAIENGESRLQRKDLLSAGRVSSDEKYTLPEHIEHFASRRTGSSDRPLLVLGLRNNLVNARAILIRNGTPFAAEGEAPGRSARAYFGIGWRDGRFVAERALGREGGPGDWDAFFSGVPVLWDDLDGEELLDCILTEAADHSHVYNLPRGNHPAATQTSLRAWSALHEVFLANLHGDSRVAARAMRQAVRRVRPPLRRCETYLHSVLGVDDRGRLINVVGHGRLEELGAAAASRGCRRAICVENSGSVMPTLLRGGIDGEPLPLLRSPNFRPKGRVVLILELENAAFETLTSADSAAVTATAAAISS